MATTQGPGGSGPIAPVSLRCSSCGAPINAHASEEYVQCAFCGTRQRVVDARAFLDQIMLQVNAWVRQALPVGVEGALISSVDPVARHAVFANNVRPRLSTEFTEYRFNAFNLLSHPLAVLPWTVTRDVALSNNPKDLFMFQAKVQSVQALAVDEDSKRLVSETNAITVSYGYVLNNALLMSELKPERYHLMAENFRAAADAIRGVERFAGMNDRFDGLSALCRGLDHLTHGGVADANSNLKEANEKIGKSKATTSQNFDTAVMLQAIEKELSVVRSAQHMADAASLDPSGTPLSTLVRLKGLMELMDYYAKFSPPSWQSNFLDVAHHEQILKIVVDVRRAQHGSPTLYVAPGTGSVLFPFWAIDIPYTFQTGALWRTQGVEVTEALLVAATFPADHGAFNLGDPSAVVTDVFRARERTGFLDETMKRVSGRETAISGGGQVRDLIAQSQLAPTGMLQVIPSLTTGQDAIQLTQSYLQRARRTDPLIDKKLRLSSPRVVKLLFVPGNPAGNTASVATWLGGLAPQSVGDLGVLSTIAL